MATSRIHGFDSLRAIAVAGVVLGHVFSLNGGFIGVDLFFVISGYVITLSLFSDLDRGELSLLRFYKNRVARILPPLLVSSAVAFMMARYLLVDDGDYETFKSSYFYQAFFLQNYYFLQFSGDYFRALEEANFSTHLWSIAIEEQFYLVYPLVFILLVSAMRLKSTILISCLVLGLSALIFILGGTGAYEALIAKGWYWTQKATSFPKYYLIQYRAWELLLGCAAYMLARRLEAGQMLRKIPPRIQSGLLIALLITVAASLFLIEPGEAWPRPVALIPTLSVALLMILVQLNTAPSPALRFLESRPLLAVGRSSYSIYLYHWPLYAALIFANYDFGRYTTDYLVYFLLLGLLSFLSYKYVEQMRGRLSPAAVICVLLVFMSFHLGVTLTSPRRPLAGTEVARKIMDTSRYSPTCESCEQNDDFSGKFLVLWGDSHAGAVVGGIERYAKQNGYKLVFLSCPPAQLNGCGIEAYERATALAGKPGFTAFIVVSRWSYYLDRNTPQESAKAVELFEAGIQRLARDFAAHRMIVLKEVPRFAFYPRREALMEGLTLRLRNTPRSAKPLTEHLREQQQVEEIFSRSLKAHRGLAFIDPTTRLCPAGSCIWRDESGVLYFDDDHLSVHGAEYVVPEIFAALEPAR